MYAGTPELQPSTGPAKLAARATTGVEAAHNALTATPLRHRTSTPLTSANSSDLVPVSCCQQARPYNGLLCSQRASSRTDRVSQLQLDFHRVEGGAYELGWLPGSFPPEVDAVVREYWPPLEWVRRVSPRRQLHLASFEIATAPVRFDSLFDPYEDTEAAASIADVCDLVDRRLAERGLRLPTEDEFEVACGAGIFWWGDRVPEGDPHSDQDAVPRTSVAGLRFESDSYKTELVRNVFKLGDGGRGVCGGAPWPIAWLSMATCYREWASEADDPESPDLLPETLEEAYLRPVRLLVTS